MLSKTNNDGKTVDINTKENRRILRCDNIDCDFADCDCGFNDGHDDGETKKDCELSLSLQHADKADSEGWQHYYLANKYYRQGNIEDAYTYINMSILYFLEKRLKPSPQIYKLRYELLIVKRKFAEASNGIAKIITLYPDYVDLHFYKGILQFANYQYEKAKKTFCYCLIIGECNLNYVTLIGAGSFLALHYIGLCCQKLGLDEEALLAFRQAEMMCPDLTTKPSFKRYLLQ